MGDTVANYTVGGGVRIPCTLYINIICVGGAAPTLCTPILPVCPPSIFKL